MAEASEEVAGETYLQLRDFKRMGVCSNWTTLNRWIEKRGLPAGIKIGKGVRLFPRSEVMAWLESQRLSPQPSDLGTLPSDDVIDQPSKSS
jgi:predicted DNA-binding transcriptional regulator AlpA